MEHPGQCGGVFGMEVIGTTLFTIHNNDIKAYDVTTGSPLGTHSPDNVMFLNGMGSESNADGDVLVVSDFSDGKLLKIDVTDPANMSSSVLVANTGTTPNGVTVKDGVATVVNWGNNADILQVDVATGDVTTLIEGTGLGDCDGVDWVGEALVVSSLGSRPGHLVFSRPQTALDVESRGVDNGLPSEQPCRPEREHLWRHVRSGLQWKSTRYFLGSCLCPQP